VLVEEPSEAECLTFLRGLAPRYEAHHRVHFTPGALAAAVRSAKRYVTDRRLPDSAIDLMDEAAARLVLQQQAGGGGGLAPGGSGSGPGLLQQAGGAGSWGEGGDAAAMADASRLMAAGWQGAGASSSGLAASASEGPGAAGASSSGLAAFAAEAGEAGFGVQAGSSSSSTTTTTTIPSPAGAGTLGPGPAGAVLQQAEAVAAAAAAAAAAGGPGGVQQGVASASAPLGAAGQPSSASASSPLGAAGQPSRTDIIPKSCPHCGTLAEAAAAVALTCARCGTRYLNVSPAQLQLGTTVLLEKLKRQQLAAGGGAAAGAGAGGGGSVLGRNAAGVGYHASSPATAHWQAGPPRVAVEVADGQLVQLPVPGSVDHGAGSSGAAQAGREAPGGAAVARGAEAARPLAPQEAAAAGQLLGGLPMWPVVDEAAVLTVVSEATGIPANQLSADDAAGLASLPQQLAEAVVGQEAAVAAVAGAVALSRLGLQRSDRCVHGWGWLTGFNRVDPAADGTGHLKAFAAKADRVRVVRCISPLHPSTLGYTGLRQVWG
jgi:hypothetical protein